AVKSGGHSGAGHSATEGGILLDLSDMKALDIDVDGRTAWAETGLTAGEVTAAVAAHGLVVGFGDTGSVGIGGITLGGGIGYLVRKHGLTIDNLVGAEIVTADGDLHRVDADHEPDLFWAIRGGGGNFGVATRFRFRLHELPGFVGGMLVLPATAETVAGFIAAAEAAPEELSTIANIMPAPPMPFLAPEVHGELVILGMLAWAGDPASGEAAIAPFRALATPYADMVKSSSYPEMFPPDEGEYHPLAVARTQFLDHVDRATASTIVETLRAYDAPMRVVQLRVLGGAMARVPAEATAFAHRTSRIMAVAAAFYEGPDDKAAREAWVEAFVAAIRQGDDGAYVNFLDDEGPDRVRDAYPGSTWDRLVELKRRYDPTNLFRLNQNVTPTAEAAR
ncbi:MAG TPA: FAD-binding oxidoreductase, partial [Candidatus Limnocylindrales bacterium]|nr:FAD-binding oxidoreductase [Candidatus Limnocylindrales bacterium]